MRGWAIIGLVTTLGLTAACGDGRGMWVDAQWQLRCAAASPCNQVDRPPRTLFGEDGDPGTNVSCAVTDIGDGLRSVNVELIANGVNRLRLRNVIINSEGAVQPTPGCQVTVDENGVLFSNLRCGPDALASTQPCRITGVDMDRNAAEGPTLQTHVECRSIQNAAGTENRDLLMPGTASPMPASIRVVRCGGV